MNITPPKIAVIVPAYNASAHIADAINSILGQSRSVDEIVVVDDGSTDDTAVVAAKASSKLIVVRQKNAGPANARQRGVESTTAEFLMLLDADDILHASALEKLSDTLLRHPLAALAYCPAEMWSPTDEGQTHVDALQKPNRENLWETLLYGNIIRTPGCVLMRRSALNEVGGWDMDVALKGNEDWDLWLRLSENHPFALVTEPLLKYRVHNASMSGNRAEMIKSMLVVFRKQRSRWKRNSSRRLAIDAGEWQGCKYAIREILHEARSAYSNGQVLLAAQLIIDVLRIGARPTLTRLFSRYSFGWWRIFCGKQKDSLTV
jgi:glycosyltransferase involved in cell wall biosynthesis